MSTLILDYAFDSKQIANPNGSLPLTFSNTTVVTGPGRTTLGNFPKALDFASAGKAKLLLNGVQPDFRQFCFQFVFKIDDPVTARQNLFESNFLPFAIYALPESGNKFILKAGLENKASGWSGEDSAFRSRKLITGKWYVVTIAYDMDTLALFITDKTGNGVISKVHAFPKGEIKQGIKKELYIGTWTNGRRDQFKGCIAAFKWHNQIPSAIEQDLDARRSHAEWFLTLKYESIRESLNPGERMGNVEFQSSTQAHIQHYQNCGIMYHASLGVAFVMHGRIYGFYKAWNGRSQLGYLVTDEMNTSKSRGRKNLFSKGGIYWTGSRAYPVLGQIYLEYENLGGSAKLGFPASTARRIGAGTEQVFQDARIYYRDNAPKAHEVHGAILAKLLSLGGVSRQGYPVSNEMLSLKDGVEIGKFSDFETCTIFWSGRTGAFEVHGDIRKRYLDLGGPAGELGFPTSDEQNIPGVAGIGKANTFQNGSVFWYGNESSIRVALPFKIWIGRVNSREFEGPGMGQNDLYFSYIGIKENGEWLYKARYPQRGHLREGNVRTLNYTVPQLVIPNDLSKKYLFTVKIYDKDTRFDSDDHLGTYSRELNPANAFGLKDNFGSYTVSFRRIRSLTWAVKPQIDLSKLTEFQKWWGTGNPRTERLTWQQCASAFHDIDSDIEWADVEDWAHKLFYHSVVKGVASGGNCFGNCVENIYARKGNSLFNMPLDQYKVWEFVRPEINIKQAYQVGAGPIWWVVEQFLTGNTHDPVDVFRNSRREFEKGNNPVLCVSKNYDFSGSPHCIMPIAWDDSAKPWKITIMDPNTRGRFTFLTVNPDENSFEYQGSQFYKGAEWTGGRLQYIPFSVVNHVPRTPLYEAMLLLFSGVVVILADDAETVSVTDAHGNDLDGSSDRAKQWMQDGNRPDQFFHGFAGFDRGSATKPGQILLRKEENIHASTSPVGRIANLPIMEAVKDRRFKKLSTGLKRNALVRRLVAGKSVLQILANPRLKARIPAALLKEMERMALYNAPRNFVQKVKGVKNGALDVLLKHGLTEVRIQGGIQSGEEHEVKVRDFGTHNNQIELVSQRAKEVKVSIRNKLGLSGDFLELEIDQVPVAASAPLQLNVRPGISGLDLVGPMIQTQVPIKVRGLVDGQRIERSFRLSVDNGVRIKPSSLLRDNELTIGAIGNIFGPILGSLRLK